MARKCLFCVQWEVLGFTDVIGRATVLQRIRFDRSPAVRLLRLRFGLDGLAAAYLWFWMLSNPFSNWETSGVSPGARPSRPMTRQR